MKNFKFKLKAAYLRIENKRIIISILLTFNLIMSFYKYDIPDLNFFEFILYNMLNSYYIFMLFLIILIIVFSNLQRKKQNFGLISKFKNKEDYIGYVIEYFVFSVCVVFIINLFVVILFSLCTYRGTFDFGSMPYYGISFGTYLTFFYFRMALILTMYGMIVILLNKNFGKIVSLCGSIFFVLNLFIPINASIVENIFDMKWIGSAYLKLVQYPTFMTEVFCSTLYILVLLIIVYGLYYIYKKYSKDIL